MATTTRATLAAALPETGRGTWRDDAVPGLELTGRRTGATWYLRRRVDGKRLRDSLGRWPGLDLAAARRAARVLLETEASRRAAGVDVLADRAGKREAAAKRREALTLGGALDLYRDDRLARLRSGQETERMLRTGFAKLIDTPLPDLTRGALLREVERKRRTAPAAADALLRVSKPLFGWIAQTERGDDLLAGVKVAQTARRDRSLSLDELGRVLVALDGMTQPNALAVRFACATGARREEAAAVRPEELDLDDALWTIPAARTKNARPHLVPLNAEALAAAEAGLKLKGEVLFPGRTGSPCSGWSKFKAALDDASGVAGWRLHDLRRTLASLCADRGEDPLTLDRILNHVGAGSLGTVGRIYQTSALLTQRRRALDLWAGIMAEAREAARVKAAA